MSFDINFYRGKKVFVTGHTGFKGSWLCKILSNAGAQVTGYSLEPPTNPSLFEIAGIENDVVSVIGDIRDLKSLKAAFDEAQPEIVLHLAAQPIVLDSYKDPAYTYETNVMGTVNILECVRNSDCVKSFLNVTTDKVYLNKEWPWGYRENEELDGFDPYSNSKSCSELVTHSYKNSFFADGKTAICRLEWALVHRYELISVIGDLSLADILCVLAEEITDERVANCQSVPKTGGLTREIF